MTKTFIISDEQVNNYGFRVLTTGIDTTQYEKNPIVLYMHNRNAENPKGNEIIGRAVKVYKKDGKLLADIEFDMEDSFAKKIAGKIDRGFIKMASPYLGVDEIDQSAKLKLKGQTGVTVSKSKLKEISIVDLGGNDGALKLFDKENNEIKLSDFSKNTIHTKKNKMDYKAIALALGLKAEATETNILNKITENNTATKGFETKLADIEKATKTAQKVESVALVDKAVELGIIPASMKDGQVKLFDADFDGSKNILTEAIAEVEKETPETETPATELPTEAKLFLDGLGKKGGNGKPVLKLSDLSADQVALMQKEKPVQFAKLVDAYEGKSY